MNTIKEIQTAMDNLAAAMVDKSLTQPSADFDILSIGRFRLWIKASDKTFGDNGYETFYADTPKEAFETARAYIDAFPAPDERVTREYLGKVADAIDFGTKHSIADKYVTPLRGVTKAMTDNLLTKEGAA